MQQTNTGSIRLWSCPAPWPCPQGAVSIMPRSMPGSCHQEVVTITRGIWSNAGLCRRDQWPKRSLVAIGALPVTGANVRISVAIRGQQAMQHKTAGPRLAQNRVTRPRNVLNGRKPAVVSLVPFWPVCLCLAWLATSTKNRRLAQTLNRTHCVVPSVAAQLPDRPGQPSAHVL